MLSLSHTSFCYLDEVLVVHNDTSLVSHKIVKLMKLNEDSGGDPHIYLGAGFKCQISQPMFGAGPSALSKQLLETVGNCQQHLMEDYHDNYEYDYD